MRKIPLRTYKINGKDYTTKTFLDEFCWTSPLWSSDEAYRAAFERLAEPIAACEAPEFVTTDADHERVTTVLSQLDFARVPGVPPTAARPLRRIVNEILDAPRESDVK